MQVLPTQGFPAHYLQLCSYLGVVQKGPVHPEKHLHIKVS